MTDDRSAHPPIVTSDEWLAARKTLLLREKELTRARDAVNAARRRLPMVRIEKGYRFAGPAGECGLLELFEGRRQLIVYHFMFDPSWDAGCPTCTGYANSITGVQKLHDLDITLALVSRAPLAKLDAHRAGRHWGGVTWYSSFGSDFNYDFHVTFDASVAPIEYNYRTAAELEARGLDVAEGEGQGLSVFFRLGDDVFHTYSTFARGTEGMNNGHTLVDITPFGRQEEWEDSPPGWPQHPTYG